MSEHKEIKRILNSLTIKELEYLKDRLLTYFFTVESDYVESSEENSYIFFEDSEMNECIKIGIVDIGIFRMSKLIYEIIEEKENEEIIEEFEEVPMIKTKEEFEDAILNSKIVNYSLLLKENKESTKEIGEGDIKMDKYADIKRTLIVLTIDELKYLKNRLSNYYFAKESDYLDLTKINHSVLLKSYNKGILCSTYEIREINNCVNDGINDIGISEMKKLVDELIEEKQNKKILKK